jgi:hypothetical protein
LLDEVATTAAFVGKPHVGYAACEKLLNEPFMPNEHRERVQNNKNIYAGILNQQYAAAEEHKKTVLKKVEETQKQTTLNIDLSKQPVKL